MAVCVKYMKSKPSNVGRAELGTHTTTPRTVHTRFEK